MVLTFWLGTAGAINDPVKHSKVLHHLHHLKAHIVFLQESHLKVSQHTSLRCRWVGQVFHSTFQSKARGIVILLHKSVPDPNGRYVIVSGTLFNTNILFVNVYAPNWDNADFFKSVFSTLPDMSFHMLILMAISTVG